MLTTCNLMLHYLFITLRNGNGNENIEYEYEYEWCYIHARKMWQTCIHVCFLLFCGQWNNSNFFSSLRLVWFACGYS